MERQTLHVQFISGFELVYGQQSMGLAKEMSSKARQLLAALLYYNQVGLSRENIIANLYQNEDSDAANSFKALVFRLRRKLQQSGLPEGDYIVSNGGLYRFGDAVTVEADTDVFRAAITLQRMRKTKKSVLPHIRVRAMRMAASFCPPAPTSLGSYWSMQN